MQLVPLIALTASLLPLSLADQPQAPLQAPQDAPAKRVAIIGAGAGGSSAAYHVRQFASAANITANITVFERDAHIGGRSTTVDAWDTPGEPVELGASIFVEVNKILVDAVREFGLDTSSLRRPGEEDGKETLGIWDGEAFVFEGPEDLGWWDMAKLFWRYGTAPVRTMWLMKIIVGRFLQMYEEPVFPWRSLTKVVEEVGLKNVLASTGEQYLQWNGVGDKFAKEIVQASTRVNYAQNLRYVDGLTTMVCMAAQGAMSVSGGNWRIFSAMAHHATSDIRLNTSVTTLAKQPSGGYILLSNTDTAGAETGTTLNAPEHYDAVILAAPHQFADLTIVPPPRRIPDKIPYVTLHVTLFASPHRLAPAAFNLAPGAKVPDVILTTLAEGDRLPHPSTYEEPSEDDRRAGNARTYPGRAGFFSISTLRRARNPQTGRDEFLYKIFSAAPVTGAWVGKILGLETGTETEGPTTANNETETDGLGLRDDDVSWVLRKAWKSYPYEFPRVTFEELVLDGEGEMGEGGALWYTSAVESFISTMETSALMGRNVARLVVDGWVSGGGGDGRGGVGGTGKEL